MNGTHVAHSSRLTALPLSPQPAVRELKGMKIKGLGAMTCEAF
jgi:hypothetical protein